MTFNITCSQKLDDGDIALVEEYKNVEKDNIYDIIDAYAFKSASKDYVDSCTITIVRNK